MATFAQPELAVCASRQIHNRSRCRVDGNDRTPTKSVRARNQQLVRLFDGPARGTAAPTSAAEPGGPGAEHMTHQRQSGELAPFFFCLRLCIVASAASAALSQGHHVLGMLWQSARAGIFVLERVRFCPSTKRSCVISSNFTSTCGRESLNTPTHADEISSTTEQTTYRRRLMGSASRLL